MLLVCSLTLYTCVLQLPRAPEAIAAEEEAQQAKRDQQLREEYSRDIRAITELRRHLRKIVATMIAKSKYTDFLYPMDPDEDPEAYSKVRSLHAYIAASYIHYMGRLLQGIIKKRKEKSFRGQITAW